MKTASQYKDGSVFRALLLEQTPDGHSANVVELPDDKLPPNEVSVRVAYSTLNYKDGMAIRNGEPVVRAWPMVPGIDLAGRVEASSHPDWRPGDLVTVNGWGLSEQHWGGMAQKASVAAEWLTRLPEGAAARWAAAVGTAGYTAMLCVLALERFGVNPDDGPVIVTGAAGGVGSVTVAVLAKLGWEVTASTGRAESEGDYLRYLGASEVISREQLSKPSSRPLLKPTWAAGVDTVGGQTLANLLASIRIRGTVAACGLAGGAELPSTVMPFIIRGVSLLGINCVYEPAEVRNEAWRRLAEDLDRAKLETMVEEISLAKVPQAAKDILAGKVRGRLVVNVNA